MKKIIILFSLLILSSCSWNYQNGNIKDNIAANNTQNPINEKEQQKAEELKRKIEIENQIASELISNFLENEDFNLKEEIQKTKERYNDNLGPILEYKHEKTEDATETNTGSQNISTGSLSETSSGSKQDENRDTYSQEINIISNKSESNSQTKIIKTKIGKSGTYNLHISSDNHCIGGLEMIDNQQVSKWLFTNSCQKYMNDFELAIGGINIIYSNENQANLTEFVSIK